MRTKLATLPWKPGETPLQFAVKLEKYARRCIDPQSRVAVCRTTLTARLPPTLYRAFARAGRTPPEDWVEFIQFLNTVWDGMAPEERELACAWLRQHAQDFAHDDNDDATWRSGSRKGPPARQQKQQQPTERQRDRGSRTYAQAAGICLSPPSLLPRRSPSPHGRVAPAAERRPGQTVRNDQPIGTRPEGAKDDGQWLCYGCKWRFADTAAGHRHKDVCPLQREPRETERSVSVAQLRDYLREHPDAAMVDLEAIKRQSECPMADDERMRSDVASSTNEPVITARMTGVTQRVACNNR